MKNELVIKIGDRGDIDGIVKLQKSIYPQYQRDTAFFTWQCFENINPSILIVAQKGKSIVGSFGIQKIKTTDDQFGGQLSWLIVDEIMRGKGLFARMGRYALDRLSNLDFVFVFANNNAIQPCKKAFGMKFIGSPCQMNRKPCHLKLKNKYSVEPISLETTFPRLTLENNKISIQKNEKNRRWRYAKCTTHNYFKVSIKTGEYAIIKLFEKEKIYGDLVDFECKISDKNRLINLFNAASIELTKKGADLITTWAITDSPLEKILSEINFVKGEPGSFFGLKTLNNKNTKLYNFYNWHLVQSDASNY